MMNAGLRTRADCYRSHYAVLRVLCALGVIAGVGGSLVFALAFHAYLGAYWAVLVAVWSTVLLWDTFERPTDVFLTASEVIPRLIFPGICLVAEAMACVCYGIRHSLVGVIWVALTAKWQVTFMWFSYTSREPQPSNPIDGNVLLFQQSMASFYSKLHENAGENARFELRRPVLFVCMALFFSCHVFLGLDAVLTCVNGGHTFPLLPWGRDI